MQTLCACSPTLPWATAGPEASTTPWYPPSFAWWGIMWGLGSGSAACSCVCGWACAHCLHSMSRTCATCVCACACTCSSVRACVHLCTCASTCTHVGTCTWTHAHAHARPVNNPAVGVFTPYFGLRPNGVNPQSLDYWPYLRGSSPQTPLWTLNRSEGEQQVALPHFLTWTRLLGT